MVVLKKYGYIISLSRKHSPQKKTHSYISKQHLSPFSGCNPPRWPPSRPTRCPPTSGSFSARLEPARSPRLPWLKILQKRFQGCMTAENRPRKILCVDSWWQLHQHRIYTCSWLQPNWKICFSNIMVQKIPKQKKSKRLTPRHLFLLQIQRSNPQLFGGKLHTK